MKILFWIVGSLATLAGVGFLVLAYMFGAIFVDIDVTPPDLPAAVLENDGAPAVLVFSKTNGFVHTDTMPVASRVLAEIAEAKGWVLFETKNGAVMNAEQLAHFDVVVWHNTSGTTLSDEQGAAFKKWLEEGGAYVGLHAAGGDFWYSWDWYVDHLIGAQFIGHTMDPQFQDATVLNQQNDTGITAHLPDEWPLQLEEWYGFDRNPRDTGSTILLTLDETSYDPNSAGMEGEHPIAWAHELGAGRVVYSAIGHQPHTYERADYQEMMARAIVWAGRLPGEAAQAMDDGTAQGTAKRWLRQAGDAVSDAYDATKDAASDAYDATAEFAEDAYDAVKEQVTEEEEPKAAGE